MIPAGDGCKQSATLRKQEEEDVCRWVNARQVLNM